jgi:hypothetical protein
MQTPFRCIQKQQQKKTSWPETASELYRPGDRRLSAKLVPTFADRECCMISTTIPTVVFSVL